MSIRKNTLINITGAIIPMLVMLVTVPLYLKLLGEVRYGVLALVWLLIGYFSFLEMGLGKATANHIARLGNTPASERSTIFWTALALNGALGLFAALILWLLGDYLLLNAFKMPEAFQAEAIAALPWLVATLPLAMVSSVLNGALEGRNQFLAVNLIQVTGNIVFQLVPLIAAYLYGPSLSIVIPAAILSRALMNIPSLFACHVLIPLTPHFGISRQAAHKLFSFGGWVAVSGVVGPVMETVDRLMIGVMLSTQAVTHYTIPNQLITRLRVAPASLSRALFPRLSSCEADAARQLAITATHTLAIVMTPLVLGGVLLFQPFMTFWVGESIAKVSGPVGELLLLGMWINSLSYIPLTLLQGRGRPDLVAAFHMMELIPFLILLWLMLHLWGIYGAAVAWVIRVITDAALLFLYARISKDVIAHLVNPAVMVISSVIAIRLLEGADWSWRLGTMIAYAIWCGLWLKTILTTDVLHILSGLKRYAAN